MLSEVKDVTDNVEAPKMENPDNSFKPNSEVGEQSKSGLEKADEEDSALSPSEQGADGSIEQSQQLNEIPKFEQPQTSLDKGSEVSSDVTKNIEGANNSEQPLEPSNGKGGDGGDGGSESPFENMTPEQEQAFAEFDKMQAEIEGKSFENSERLDSLKETFSKDNWDNLTEGQKLDACMELRDYIKDDLDMDSSLNIEFVDDMDSRVAGTAEDTDHEGVQIKINMNDLDDPEKMVDSISHESFHAYQHEQVDKLGELEENDESTFKAEQWKQDFDGQTGDAGEDYNLSVEQDARRYASNVGSRIFGQED